ncbi:MAG: chorismate synthase [Kiritimatiellae bacterium]|nr:chorismate synthase [Kiritimatiellia bacterium]MDD5521373.1 chorismate synthase [Kiritimatiellia bacterium]
MFNTFGNRFRLTTFGESHGKCVGAVVDGCPSRLKLSAEDIQVQLDRRRPGQSRLTTARNESDVVRILSGVENGITLGSPIALAIDNLDRKPGDYTKMLNMPRPSHADLTYKLKYSILASSGGGRASARETVGRVAGGAVAEKFLVDRFGVKIVAWVSSVEGIDSPDLSEEKIEREDVDCNELRCPDLKSAAKMIAAIERAAKARDSVGGVVTCVCRNVPAGWGEPVFGKATALLAGAMLSIPACRGFEIGAGFAATRMRGSEHNDMYIRKGKTLGTVTNRSGGIQGGITNGEPVVFRVAFKPTASIGRAQRSADYKGKQVICEVGGRHDPCVVPRAVPIVEAMAALVFADIGLMAG